MDAGVVGRAVGRTLARAGLETLVLKSEAAIRTQTSARDSEVVHAGLDHPTGCWKARPCVRGHVLLYDVAERHGVPPSTGMVDGHALALVPPSRPAKGGDFTLAGRAPFGRLVCSVPEGGGLGVHLRLDLAGKVGFGPDVERLAPKSPGLAAGLAIAEELVSPLASPAPAASGR